MSAPKLWCAVALMGCVALAVNGPRGSAPRGDTASGIAEFPRDVGGWHGRDVALSDRQYALLESRDVLFRNYRRGSAPPVLACVAVAGGNRKVAHPPEICYRGQGWEILSQSWIQVPVAGRMQEAEELRIEQDGRQVLVISWYRVGRRSTPSYLKQQWWGLCADLTASGEPSALLRFSAPAPGSDWDAADRVLREFLVEVVPRIEETLDRPPLSPESDP